MDNDELREIFAKAEARELQFRKLKEVDEIIHDDFEWFSNEQGHKEAE